MQFSVREANLRDYEALCELFAEADSLHSVALPQVFQTATPPRSREYLAGVLADERATIFVAEAAGEVVGLVSARVADARTIPILVQRRYAFVDDLVVKARFRSRGIGRSLMKTAANWAVSKGATSIELDVWEFNQAATTFYESQGYKTISRRMDVVLRSSGPPR